MSMMDENMTMETVDTETVEPEVVDDDYEYEYDVVETEPGENHGMLKTAVKAGVGLVVAVGGIFGITKAVKKRQNKYIQSTPKGLIRCK